MKTVAQHGRQTPGQNQTGFAIIEAVLILVIIGAVVGVGAYVLNAKKTVNKTLSSGTTTPAQQATPVLANGTTASIDQLTQQEAQSETAANNSGDSQLQQDSSSSNASVSNVGSSYNESSL